MFCLLFFGTFTTENIFASFSRRVSMIGGSCSVFSDSSATGFESVAEFCQRKVSVKGTFCRCWFVSGDWKEKSSDDS